MGFWFTLIVCAAWINISYAQSAGQDGSECNNKLEQIMYRQVQDLASMMMDIKTVIMISSRQEERMAEIETQIANIETSVQTRMENMETKLTNITTEVGNLKTEVTNNVQTIMANIGDQVTNVSAQIVDAQTTLLRLSTGDLEDCMDGWVAFTHSCYLIKLQGKAWQGAQTACKRFGGHLVAINSEAEFNFLKSEILKKLPRTDYQAFWTGGKKRNNSWVWMLSGGVTANMYYTNWYSGEPNNAQGREDVVNILFNDGSWGFNDHYANDSLRYICEKRRGV